MELEIYVTNKVKAARNLLITNPLTTQPINSSQSHLNDIDNLNLSLSESSIFNKKQNKQPVDPLLLQKAKEDTMSKVNPKNQLP